MLLVCKDSHPVKSSVIFLPVIDMDPKGLSCIYSTLKFTTTQAKTHNCKPVNTFDQPLWLKAHGIIENESEDSGLHNVVLRLGGFHTQMSFVGMDWPSHVSLRSG